MLSPKQIAYELDYWRQTDRAKSDARQRKILQLWGFSGAPSVLEIGTGPWGGSLPFVKAERMVGLDLMFEDYAETGLLPSFNGHGRTSEPLGTFSADPFEAILCMNTLDHGNSDFTAIDSITCLLKPGGRFYLHVNLRTPEQLNEGHDHSLRFEDLKAAIDRNGLREIKCDLYDHDPIEWAPYPTVVGIWEK
jgi:SAM-dependent methyltransferase